MHAYLYQAALLCEDCGLEVRRNFDFVPGVRDSSNWPQGPYANGGGEADCPQHCDHCGLFLENPLTTDGMEYVREKVEHARYCGWNGTPPLKLWAPFYGIQVDA